MSTPASKDIIGTKADFEGEWPNKIVPFDQGGEALLHLPGAVWVWGGDAGGKFGWDIYNGVSWRDASARGGRASPNWGRNWQVVIAPIPPDIYGKNTRPDYVNSKNNIYKLVVRLANSMAGTTGVTLPASAPDWAKTFWTGLQNLDTTVANITEGVNSAAIDAKTAADNSKVAADTKTQTPTSTLLIAGVAIVALFFFWKK